MQLEPWHLITFGIAIITGFAAVLKYLFMQFSSSIKDRFTALDKRMDDRFIEMDSRFSVLHEDAKNWIRLEREFLNFKAELPVNYVRREDSVRNQTVLEAKLDALYLKVENKQLQEAAKHEH